MIMTLDLPAGYFNRLSKSELFSIPEDIGSFNKAIELITAVWKSKVTFTLFYPFIRYVQYFVKTILPYRCRSSKLWNYYKVMKRIVLHIWKMFLFAKKAIIKKSFRIIKIHQKKMINHLEHTFIRLSCFLLLYM